MTAPILLLHGALGSAQQMEPFAEHLSQTRAVYVYNFPGHGGQPIPDTGYDLNEMVEALASYVSHHLPYPADVFGYSMGGYASAVVASRYPELFRTITTLGTKWDWSLEIATREVSMLDPNTIEAKVPALAQLIQSRHQPNDWKKVVRATAQMLLKLGDTPLLNAADFSRITIPVTILRGTADRIVDEAPSIEVAHSFPNGTYFALKDAPHPFEQVDISVLKPFLLHATEQS